MVPAMIMAFLVSTALLQMHLQLLQTYLPIEPVGTFFIIATIGILVILVVAAIVYGLSGTVNSPAARAWSRAQIYEALLSALMLVVFVTLILIFFVNPTPSFSSIGLNPNGWGCGNADDLYQLSTCNLALFNSDAYGVFDSIFTIATIFGFSSGITLAINPWRGAESAAGQGTNIESSVGFALDSIFPVTAESLLGFMFSALLTVILLNQIQLLILGGALLWLGFFLTLGLIARSFGFTRSFGGSMIAIGLGLGFVFPLTMAMTYGFLDNVLTAPGGLGCSFGQGGCTGAFFTSAVQTFVSIITYQGLPAGAWVFQLAVLGAGLTFIPFLNFTLVETFIVDFSKAIGERIDFSFILNI